MAPDVEGSGDDRAAPGRESPAGDVALECETEDGPAVGFSLVSVGQPKTDRGRRSVALDQGTVAALRDHRRRMLEERLLVGADFDDLGLVFHQPDGTWLRPDAVSAAFLRRVRRYGLPRLTLHGLRHTWATLALERGIHPRVLQERLGHSTIASPSGSTVTSPRPSTTRRPSCSPTS